MSELEFPLIDSDPTFFTVVKLFRPSDYLTILGGSLGTAMALVGWNKLELQGHYKKTIAWASVFGLVGGFLFAYQTTSFRLWGEMENKREQKLYPQILRKETVLEPHLASAAYRNSKNSQSLLSIIPFFNFVNHNKGVNHTNE